jgi:hypothetical protein
MHSIEEALSKPGVVVDRWILRLGKSDNEAGKFAPWFLPSDTFKQDLEGFLACLNLVKVHEAVKGRMSTQAKNVRAIRKQIAAEQKEIAKMKAKVDKAEAKAKLKIERTAEKERIKTEAKAAREAAKSAKTSKEVISTKPVVLSEDSAKGLSQFEEPPMERKLLVIPMEEK